MVGLVHQMDRLDISEYSNNELMQEDDRVL